MNVCYNAQRILTQPATASLSLRFYRFTGEQAIELMKQFPDATDPFWVFAAEQIERGEEAAFSIEISTMEALELALHYHRQLSTTHRYGTATIFIVGIQQKAVTYFDNGVMQQVRSVRGGSGKVCQAWC